MNSPTLNIDLSALAENYHRVCALSDTAEVACVVKADAYGLGVGAIAPALAASGAKTFFVATKEEGVKVRHILPTATIYIFNGLNNSAANNMKELAHHNLRPCLSSLEEIALWTKTFAHLPAAIHIDTGINRLGLSLEEWRTLSLPFTPALLMTHLSSADTPNDPINKRQKEKFDLATKDYDLPKSIANSAGILLGTDWHGAMVRSGIALYGGNPREDDTGDKFAPVVSLTCPLKQMRNIQAGEPVGYGCDWTASKPTKIALLTLGYGDGYPRLTGGGRVFLDGSFYPIVGRVSMDMLCIDLGDTSPPSDARVELLGKNITISDLAQTAQTIPHHILTQLGKRITRTYNSL